MTLRNEIFEGLAAAKAGQDIVRGMNDPRDQYYKIILEEAKRKRDQDEKIRRDAEAAEAGRPTQLTPRAPARATTQQPGVPLMGAQAMNTGYQLPGTYRRGGRVRRYATGGTVGTDLTAMPTPEAYTPPPTTAIDIGSPKTTPDTNFSGSANAGTGSSGDAGGGVSGGTGGIGGADPGGQGDTGTGTGTGDTYRRGGRIRRYADGGAVDTEDEESEADLIVRSLLSRDIGPPQEAPDVSPYLNAPGEISRAVPVPDVDEDVVADVRKAAEPIKREITRKINTDLSASPPSGHPDTPPGAFTPKKSRVEELKEKFTGGREGAYSKPDIRTEKGFDDQWRRDLRERRNKAHVLPTEQVTPEERLRRDREVEAITAEEREGSPSERIKQRAKAFDENNPRPSPPDRTQPEPTTTPPSAPAPAAGSAAAATAQQPPPETPPVTVAAKQPGSDVPPMPDTMRGIPGVARGLEAGPPSTIGASSSRDVLGLNPPGKGWGNIKEMADARAKSVASAGTTSAAKPPAVPPAGAPNAPSTVNGPGTSGTTGPGLGNGAPAAPPITSSGTPGAVSDPRRVKAFDPKTERGIGAVDAEGRDIRGIATGPPQELYAPAQGSQQLRPPSSGMTGGQADQGLSSNNAAQDYQTQDISQMLAGAHSAAGVQGGQPPFIGHKAASRETLQQVIQVGGGGGDVSPGAGMLRGMLSMYKNLLRFGRIEEANKMAYGVIQAANLEMASYGAMAIDKLRRGDFRGATQDVIDGVEYAPDDMTQRVSADGRSIETYDKNGKLTGQTPVNGSWILAAATGMRNGTMLWQLLQSSAAQLSKEKNPEGRALQNLIRAEQLRGLQLRNNKLSAPPRGGGGLNATDLESRELLSGVRGSPPTSGGGGGGGPSADDVAHNAFLDREQVDSQ